MVRLAIRVFLSPATIALLDLVILVPIVLSILSVLSDLSHGELHEPMDILEDAGVVLIGWGVAIEERLSVRGIFGLTGGANEAYEAGVDVLCHSSGVGLLIFGLFSEIGVAAVRLPNHIVPTEGIDEWVLGVSAVFIGLSAYVLAQNIVRLTIAVLWGRVPAQH